METLILELSIFDPQTVKNTIFIQNGRKPKALDLETFSLGLLKIVYDSVGVGTIFMNHSQKRIPKGLHDKFQPSPVNLKEKETPDLPSVCLNYWPPNVALSLCFNHLVLLTFWQCRSAIPKRYAKPIASIHHTVQHL